MSEKQKFDAQAAMAVANDLKCSLAQFCERIEIAGSLRRGKSQVGDIELLFIPRFGTVWADLLKSEQYDMAGAKVQDLLRSGVLAKRPNSKGFFTWGPRNKLAVHVKSGIPVDFFSTTLENWWVSLVIRTGSKETNLALTTGAIARGCRLHAYGAGVTDKCGTMIPATSEKHVFELCGVPYKEPKYR